jgi:uncharacterized protein YjbJ (UPF0337 family)
MDKNRIGAIGHQLKGTLKEGLGKIIGDAKLTADGAAERAVGEAQNSAGAGGPLIDLGVDTDRIAGIGHQLKGALKESLGKMTGNRELTAAGIAERVAGKAQNAVGSVRDEAREALESEHAAIVTDEKTDAGIDTPKR